MPKFLKDILEWCGHAQTLQSIIGAAKWPAGAAMLTGLTGYLQEMPYMWIIMASALVFMGIAVGITYVDYYKNSKSPRNKIRYIGTMVNYDLIELNRHGNKANKKLAKNNVILTRQIDKVQIGVQLRNDATFPISVILFSAKTEMEKIEPPRSDYPKKPIVLLSGNTLQMMDVPIPMGGIECKKLEGRMELVIKYGLKGKENEVLEFKGRIDAMMLPAGFINGIYTSWDSEQIGT